MKILIFNWMDILNPSFGGAEVVTHEIAKRFVQEGNAVTVFTSMFKGCKKEETVDGIKIYRGGNRYTVYWEARKYYNKYFKGKYDVIIDEINTVPFFTPKFAKNGEKIFVLIHQLAREFWFHETKFPVNLLGYYFLENRWLKVYKNIPTLTVSNSTKKDLESLGFKNIFVIPEGLKLKPLEKIPEKEKEPTFIFVGRLKSSKNPGDAIKAYIVLKKTIPQAKLWIIGDGYLREKYELITQEGITFWGFLPEKKRNELMSRAHIILVPGIREGWGLVVTEANAMGTPAVAYDVPGLRDSVKHNITGLLCRNRKPEELAAKAILLLKDNILYKKLCVNSLEWSKSFSWDKSTSECLNVLSGCLNEKDKYVFKRKASRGERVLLLAEVTMPPLSRANLRIVKLAEALSNFGHSVTMLTPSLTPLSRKSYLLQRYHMNQFWGFCKYSYSKYRVVVRMWHLIGTILAIIILQVRYFDISIIHAWNPLAGVAAIIAGRIINKPVYIDFTDFYSDIAKTDSPYLALVLRILEKMVLRLASKIFVVSNQMKDELVRWKIKPDNIFIVPDGTDIEMFNPSISGEEVRKKYNLGNVPIIVYHGDIKEQDGVDLLYQAFVKVQEKVPGVKLMIVGGGGKYFDNIINLGKRLGIHSDIIYTGWIQHKEVPMYLAAADVGAMPMRATLNHNCYLSFKLFEYWGVGKPVVVSRLKAISEIVINEYNGILCDPENIDSMVNAYTKLLLNHDVAKELGLNGRRLVESHFNWETLMSKEVMAYGMNSSLEQEIVTKEGLLPGV